MNAFAVSLMRRPCIHEKKWVIGRDRCSRSHLGPLVTSTGNAQTWWISPLPGLSIRQEIPTPLRVEVLVLERALKTLPARREIAIVYARSFLQQERHLSPSLRRLTDGHEMVRHETDHGHAGPKPLVVILDAARVLLRVAEGHPVFHDRSGTDQLLCQISRRGVISAIATFDGANSSSRPENAQNPSLTMALRVGPPFGSTS